MVFGVEERFRDVKTMVEEWDSIENDESEWLPVEGVRRGGRKLSRRISELMRSFQEGGGGEGEILTDRLMDGGKDTCKTTFSFPNSTKVKPTLSKEKVQIRPGVIITKFEGQNIRAKESRDWLRRRNFSANQSKRKFEADDSNGDGDLKTKKRRPGR